MNKKPNGEVVIIDKVKEIIKIVSNEYETVYHIQLESNILVRVYFYPNVKKGTKLKVWGRLVDDILEPNYCMILNPQKKLWEFMEDNDNVLGNAN